MRLSARIRGWPILPRTGPTPSTRGSSCVTSLRLPPVNEIAGDARAGRDLQDSVVDEPIPRGEIGVLSMSVGTRPVARVLSPRAYAEALRGELVVGATAAAAG